MSSAIHRRGLMLVLSSPSGAGKTTLARGLLAADDNIAMSVSVTTRKPRPGETDGHDHHLLDTQAFGEMRNRGELLSTPKCSTIITARRGRRWKTRCAAAAMCCSTLTGRARSSCRKRRPMIW